MELTEIPIKINRPVISWLKLARNFRNYKLKNFQNLSINNYLLLFLFFKYLIFKDICLLYYKDIFIKFQLNLYFNLSKKEYRLYFLFYYIMLYKHPVTVVYFLDYFFLNIDDYIPLPDDDDFRKKYPSTLRYDKRNNIFFYTNNTFLYIYLIKRLFNFFFKFNKLKYYKISNNLNKIFLFNNFILKVDYATFFLQRRYIPFFRLFKYNEYLSNNKLFWKYPKLKRLLYIKFKAYRVKHKIFLKNLIINYINIYKLNLCKSLDNKYIFIPRFKDFSILHRKTTRHLIYNNFKNLYIDNPFFIYNIKKQHLFKFIYLNNISNIYKFINIFSIFYGIYISFISYKIYQNYILKFYYFKKKKCRHLISIYWKYNLLNFQFFPFLFRIFYKFINFSFFFRRNLINYGFLTYFFLDNHKFLNYLIKKNILLYRIKNIIIVEYINKIYIKLYKDINKEGHKFKKFSQPDVFKKWQINYIKYFKESPYPKVAEVYTKIYEKNKKIINAYNNRDIKSILELNLNYVFEYLWKIINRWTLIIFTDILNLVRNKDNLISMFSNYKYSLEYISWEILNSNNKYYTWNIYSNKLFSSINAIQLDNIIINYLNKYINSLIQFFSSIPLKTIIYSSFSYLFIRDFFFRIISKLNKKLFLKQFIFNQKYIIYLYKNNYFYYFNWQLRAFIGVRRYILFYQKYRMFWSEFYLD